MSRRNGPTALSLSRQKIELIDREKYASAEGSQKGGYVLAEADDGAPQLIIIATGTEVGLAMETRNAMQADGVPTRVVSMPCWELFEEQTADYKAEVLPENVTARLAIEAGIRQGWERYIGLKGDAITVDRFGASAPANIVFEQYGFTLDNALAKAKNLIE